MSQEQNKLAQTSTKDVDHEPLSRGFAGLLFVIGLGDVILGLTYEMTAARIACTALGILAMCIMTPIMTGAVRSYAIHMQLLKAIGTLAVLACVITIIGFIVATT